MSPRLMVLTRADLLQKGRPDIRHYTTVQYAKVNAMVDKEALLILRYIHVSNLIGPFREPNHPTTPRYLTSCKRSSQFVPDMLSLFTYLCYVLYSTLL